MKRTEWQTLKAEIKTENLESISNGNDFVYQFTGPHEQIRKNLYQQPKNGNSPSSSVGNDNFTHPNGYKFSLTNLAVMYEEELSESEVMEMCKRLNPNIEVPDVTDLIQQLELMLQSDTTERKLLFYDNRGKDNEHLAQTTCTLKVDGELAGCEFKWEFSPKLADSLRFFEILTKPIAGCLTLLLRNQSRLVQLLEAKDQEIQDYTLNGAVLSRKSLQTTIFDSKKEALTIPSDFTKDNILDSLRSPEYSEALRLLNASDDTKDIFIAPLAPMGSKTDVGQRPSLISESSRKRSYLPNTTASVMRGPKPLQSSQKLSQRNSEDNSNEVSQKISDEESSLQQSQRDNNSPQIKRTRSSRRSANNTKNLLKKF